MNTNINTNYNTIELLKTLFECVDGLLQGIEETLEQARGEVMEMRAELEQFADKLGKPDKQA